MTPFKRIMFEAAVAHAAGLVERYPDDPMFIQQVITGYGIEIRVLSRRDDRSITRLVGWHDLEQRQYDALRIDIDAAVREFIGYRQAA